MVVLLFLFLFIFCSGFCFLFLFFQIFNDDDLLVINMGTHDLFYRFLIAGENRIENFFVFLHQSFVVSEVFDVFDPVAVDLFPQVVDDL